jgi:hypothetical protein
MVSVWRAPAAAQPPVRTRDVGFAVVEFDNGGTFAATTLNESLVLERSTGSLLANGLVSVFQDGRWSMQGVLAGSRYSDPLAVRGPVARWFRHVRGEMSLVSLSTAQQGLMPTLHVAGQARLHFSSDTYIARAGASVARTFDGVGWRTTVIGEASGWWQVTPRASVSVTSTPMQLQFGDLLGDHEGALSLTRGHSTYGFSAGLRVGEADKANVFWSAASATWPVTRDLYLTASIGSYPVDLIQSLPGGRYFSVAARLPGAKWPTFRRIQAPLPVAPPRPARPELPRTETLALVIGPALDSLELREVRVWAPGVRVVEMMADFVDWLPVPLVRVGVGEWQGFYRVPAGAHRLNLRLDGRELAVPRNLPTVTDDFSGVVALVVVR